MGLIKIANGTYYYRFKASENKKFTKYSLHTKDKNEAEHLAEVFIRENRDKMDDFRGATLRKLREDFEEYHIKHKPKSTRANYKIVFDRLERLLRPECYVKQINAKDIEKLKDILVIEGKSPFTINSYLRNVKCIFNKAVHKFKLLVESPFEEIDFLDEPERNRAFNENEVNFLAENIDKKIIVNTFLTGIYGGMRKGEILHIRWRDINMNHKTISVINNRAHKTKTRKNREVPISEELFFVIKNIQYERFGDVENNVISLDEYVFANPEGKPYDGGYLSREFKKYLRAFGFDEDYNFHSTRFTFATISARNGVALHDIQKIMGHTKPSTTEKYVKVASAEMHEAVNRNHVECIRKRYIDSKIHQKVFEMSNVIEK